MMHDSEHDFDSWFVTSAATRVELQSHSSAVNTLACTVAHRRTADVMIRRYAVCNDTDGTVYVHSTVLVVIHLSEGVVKYHDSLILA